MQMKAAIALGVQFAARQRVHGHALRKQTRSQRVERAADRVAEEIDTALARAGVSDIDTPVRLHRRGQQLAQRPKHSRAEMPVPEAEKRQQRVAAIWP